MRRLIAGLALVGALWGTPAWAETDKVQSQSYETVAYFSPDGDGWKLQGSSYQTLGSMRPDGQVRDASYRTLGYLGEGHVIKAAVFFFFLPVLRGDARND